MNRNSLLAQANWIFFSHKGKIEGGEARKEGQTEEGQGEIQRPG
jgi:hypothetical protein